MTIPKKNRSTGLRSPFRKRRSSVAGYTLLELLVVMGILAILTAVATPQVMGYFNKAKAQSVQLQIGNIKTALEMYYMENGSYPSSADGLDALVKAPGDAPRWNGPYLKQQASLTDPWGHPYRYLYPTDDGQYEVSSVSTSRGIVR